MAAEGKVFSCLCLSIYSRILGKCRPHFQNGGKSFSKGCFSGRKKNVATDFVAFASERERGNVSFALSIKCSETNAPSAGRRVLKVDLLGRRKGTFYAEYVITKQRGQLRRMTPKVFQPKEVS